MDKSVVGVVAIVVDDRPHCVPAVQDILTEFGECIIGRMGVPHRPAGLHIISVVVYGVATQLAALGDKLGQIEGVRVTTSRVDL